MNKFSKIIVVLITLVGFGALSQTAKRLFYEDVQTKGSFLSKSYKFQDADESEYIKIRSANTLGSSYEYVLPSADGSNGQVLSTNGSGILSFITPADSVGVLRQGSTVDNTIVRWHNSNADFIQGSSVVLSDTNSITGLVNLTATGDLSAVDVNASSTVGALDVNARDRLILQDGDESARINIQAPNTLSASYTLTMPADDGTSNQFLQTNGSGVLTWATGGGGNTMYFHAAKSGTQSTTSGATPKVTWSSATIDSDSCFDNANDRCEIVNTGVYVINAKLVWNSNTTGYRQIHVYKNGSPFFVNQLNAQGGALVTALGITTPPVSLTAGDDIEIYAFQNGGTIDLLDDSAAVYFSIWRVD